MDSAKQKLVKVASLIMSRHKEKIEELKKNRSDIDREDFVWHYLMQSFSTMGRSSGWQGLIGTEANYNEIRYERLKEISESLRFDHLREVCRRAKVRMPDTKAKFIFECFKQIESLGGYKKVRTQLLNLEGRDSKIKFLRQFTGIGPKYSRNMMMDVYHPDFHNSIAVDTRIKSVLKALNVEFKTYAEAEEFLLDVAKMADMNGWELDRLMYNYLDEFLRELGQ